MPDTRSFPKIAILTLTLLTCPAALHAQRGGGGAPAPPGGGGGGRPAPGPAIPQAPRPGGVPQPWQPGGPNPARPGAPIPGQPNVPNPAQPLIPGMPQQPSAPWAVQNPFSPQSRSVQPGVPAPYTQAYVPSANITPEWQQTNNFIRSGNYTAAQQHFNEQMSRNPSLDGMMSATTAMQRANAPPEILQQMQKQTLNLAQSQINQGINGRQPYAAVAQLSLQGNNQQQFRQATQDLVQRYPDSEYAHYYTGIRQMQDGDYKAAEQSLRLARDKGMPEESVAQLLKMAIDGQKWVWQYAEITLYVILAWMAGLGFLFISGIVLSKLTLRSAQRTTAEAASFSDRILRRAYRLIVNLAGLYYYVSLPIVVVLAIALPLTIGYALLIVPVLNLLLIPVVLILGVGGILTALSGVKAAFTRVKSQDFGRVVSPEEAPELWAVAREVAERVGTRPVDEIRLLPGAEAAVTERGSFMQRMRDRGQRVLILGVAALQGLKLDALKCILAHEYGHFQHRDTAGGDVALRVNVAMMRFAEAIGRRWKVRWWDVSFHFLRLYHFLYRRLTFGASRLQEVMADRVAVLCYGSNAFVEGLTQAIRSSLEFDLNLSLAVRQMLRNSQQAASFYASDAHPELSDREQVEVVLRSLLERPTNVEDSHPSPGDRFAQARRIDPQDRPIWPQPAWSLLEGNDGLIHEMSQFMSKVVSDETGRIQQEQQTMLRLLSSVLRDRHHVDAYFQRARIYASQGEFNLALRDLNTLLRYAPAMGEAIYARALNHKALGQHELAVEDLSLLAKKLRPGDLNAENRCQLYTTLGQSLAKLGQMREAIAAFTDALKNNPKSLVATVERGRAFAALDDTEPALRDFSAAITQWPRGPEAYLERARIHDAAGNSELAERDRKSASELGPRAQEAPRLANVVIEVS